MTFAVGKRVRITKQGIRSSNQTGVIEEATTSDPDFDWWVRIEDGTHIAFPFAESEMRVIE